MIVLHGLWSSQSAFWLWGEDLRRATGRSSAGASASAGARPSAGARAAPARASSKPRNHPFAASHADLAGALTIQGGDPVKAALSLPSAAGRPHPSPGLVRRGARASRGRPTLQAWRIPALAFAPTDAIDLLLALGAPGAPVADSLRYLSRATELVLEMVAGGRVLPGLVATPGARQARWLPFPSPADEERLRVLAQAMPPSLRAELQPAGIAEPAPGSVLAGLLVALVDAECRRALDGRHLLAPRRGRRPRSVPAGEAFMRALTADPVVDADPGELDKLERALDDWHRSGFRSVGAVRTCFRLVFPEPGDDVFRVELLLQSTADPSLLVPAAEVWRSGETLTFLDHALDHPQERMLSDLGRAMRLYPALESALQQATPESLELDASGAHDFLTQAAPLLEQSGFGVLVPGWRSRRLALRMRTRSATASNSGEPSGLLGIEGLLDYRYEIAMGDETLSARQLAELARLKAPLVRMRGEWVLLRREDIQAALDLLEQQPKRAPAGQLTGAEALRMALGAEPGPGGLPVAEVDADGWLGELLSSEDRKLTAVRQPAGLDAKLRPYQRRGLGWLTFLDSLGLGGILADDMGLGKTLELLSLLVHERSEDAAAGPTLVVCPMSVAGNWQREAERFAPALNVHVHHGADRSTTFKEAAADADLVITTYGLAARDTELLASVAWGRVVLDEAQNVKNPLSRQARAVRDIPATRRVALTGTPVENRLLELWSIMDFCNPGLLGPQTGFRERFAVPIERYRDEEASALLRRVTQPFVLRRLKTDRSIIRDLPDKVEMKAYCNLTREQATLYQAVVDDMLERIERSDGIERKGLVLATMTKLKQVCNHPAHLLQDGSSLDARSGKLQRLEELLEEATSEGDRTLVFTQYAEMGHLLRAHLYERLGSEIPFLYGGVPKRARDEMVAAFQAPDGPPVMLLSLKAGGVGLNLTAASQVVHFDRWWNPAVEDQATDRAFRIGQKRNVQVRKLVCVGTLEERIDQLIESKRDLAGRIVGTGEAWLTELSTGELRDLITLGADAVVEG